MGSAAAAAALGHILPGAADAAAAARCVHQGARPLSAVRTLAGRSACPPSRRPASRWGLRRRQPRSLSRWGTGGRREGGSGADLKVSGVRAEPAVARRLEADDAAHPTVRALPRQQYEL